MKVILVSGISGSGKTHQSKLIEKQGYVRLSLDEIIWKRHGKEFGSLPFGRQRELTRAAEEELAEAMETELRQGHDVVIDACLCKRIKRDSIRRRAESAGADVELIYLEASLPTLASRLEGRSGNSPDQIIVSPEMLEGFYQGFQRPEADENALVIKQD